jgi:hypothetical protein
VKIALHDFNGVLGLLQFLHLGHLLLGYQLHGIEESDVRV